MFKRMLDKYKDIVAYLFFGVCTTVVNVLTYWFCAYVLHLNTIIATSIAWALAVAFAYVTNRLWVFHSNAKTRKEIFREICSFTACRLLTGFLDVAIMYVFVDRFNCPDVIVKIISNIVVIIVNYIASKLFIFNKNDNRIMVKKVLIVFALVLISFCLAQLSEWGIHEHADGYIDANVYKYVGQVIRDGGMPYKDVFDHKGPLLYIMQAVGGYIDEYHGEWVFEFLAIFVTVCMFYLIARFLRCKPGQALLATIVPMTLLESTYGGTHGAGVCCCLLAMPFASISLYIFIKYLVLNKVKNISVWLCGACCGAVLMLRPNIIAVWAVFGVIIAIKTIREKQIKDLFRFVGLFLLGVACLVVPCVVWLATNGALEDFYEQFIEFNFFYSGAGIGMTSRIDAIVFFLSFEIIAFAVGYMVYRIIVHREKMDIYALIFFVASVALASMPGHAWHHYVNMLFPSLIYPYSVLFAQLPTRVKKGKKLAFTSDVAGTNAIVVLAIFAIVIVPIWAKIIRNDISSLVNAKGNSESTLNIVKVINEYTDEDDKIQVFGHIPVIYNVSNRRAATRFMFYTKAVGAFRDNNEEFFNALRTEKPKIIVMPSIDYHNKDMNLFLKEYSYKLVYPKNENGEFVDPNRNTNNVTYVFYRPSDNKND